MIMKILNLETHQMFSFKKIICSVSAVIRLSCIGCSQTEKNKVLNEFIITVLAVVTLTNEEKHLFTSGAA